MAVWKGLDRGWWVTKDLIKEMWGWKSITINNKSDN